MPKSAMSKPPMPRTLALLVGLGALSAAGANAATPTAGAQGQPGGLAIRYDGDRIAVSENGGDFRLLTLADTPEARRLTALLQGLDQRSAELRLPPTILAGDGGSGFHWTPAGKTAPAKSNATVKTRGQAQPQPQPPSNPAEADRRAKG